MPKVKLTASYPLPLHNNGKVNEVEQANIDNIVTRYAQEARSPEQIGVRIANTIRKGARILVFQFESERLAHNASKRIRRACKRNKTRIYLSVE